MSLAVAIQMDPVETIDIDADSSFVLALEAQSRGHALFHYGPGELSLKQGRVIARARPLELRREAGNHYSLGSFETLDLEGGDVVLMRQDPPFDMSYITTTHLLEHIHPQTLVVNDPVHVRNAPEKLFVTHFAELMPPTLITTDRDEVLAFRVEHKDIIVTPLFGNGGAGVFHIAPEDENLTALLEMFTQLYREPIIVQRYVPAVRANMHVGAAPEKAVLTERDREICSAIGPTLAERGLIFVGIDVIGDYMTEINVTSPTGIQEINRFDGVALEADIWDAIEPRFAQRRYHRRI